MPPDVRVLDHEVPLAYCLPGRRTSRVVVSAGTLGLLAGDEVDAVLAHERAHLRARHDLVLEAFDVLHRAFPRWVSSARRPRRGTAAGRGARRRGRHSRDRPPSARSCPRRPRRGPPARTRRRRHPGGLRRDQRPAAARRAAPRRRPPPAPVGAPARAGRPASWCCRRRSWWRRGSPGWPESRIVPSERTLFGARKGRRARDDPAVAPTRSRCTTNRRTETLRQATHPTPATHISPPTESATSGEVQPATSPARRLPTSGPETPTMPSIELIRPRKVSGVASWVMVPREITETVSAAPATRGPAASGQGSRPGRRPRSPGPRGLRRRASPGPGGATG